MTHTATFRMKPARSRRARGITLLMTLIIIIALLGLGLMGVWISSMSTHVAGSLGARQAASNAAMAGIQHGRMLLTAIANTAATSCPAQTPAQAWSCPLQGQGNAKDLLPTSSNPKNYGAILYDAAQPLIAINSPSGGGTPVGSYTVWVRNDGADIATAMASGNPNANLLIDVNGAVILRSEGRDPSGTALVVLEAATTRLAIATGSNVTNTIFGKNIDPYGSNALTGSFHF